MALLPTPYSLIALLRQHGPVGLPLPHDRGRHSPTPEDPDEPDEPDEAAENVPGSTTSSNQLA